jgi:hypothetical protein
MVEQDIFLFAGTVRENLTLWDSTVPEADLVRAATDAAIHDLILNMPGGYDAQLSEAVENQLEKLSRRLFKPNDLKKELLGAIDCCERSTAVSVRLLWAINCCE